MAASPEASFITATWNDIKVEYGRMTETGEFDFAMPKHAISVAFAPHDRVTWSIDGNARQTTPLPAGSVFLYGDCTFVWHQRHQPSEYINLFLEPAFLDRIAAEHGLPPSTGIDRRVIFIDPTILHIAQLLKAEAISGGLAGDLYVESLRNLLAIHLLRNHSGVSATSKEDAPKIDDLQLKQVRDYIEANLDEDLTITDLANLIPMSQFHFARAFKSAIGESPHRYVTQRRIEQAKVLLSVTKLPVAEVAYRVGFSNQSHFTAQFRKVTGTTPKHYRDRC
jgi:AraC family transcriptional regulator